MARFDRSFVISIEYSYVRFSIVLLKLRRRRRKSYSFLLPSTMTSTGSLFFSFQLPGLCGSDAYVFSSGTRNSRRELEEVTSAWTKEVYRGRVNRGRHLPSEKLKVVCCKVYTPIHFINADPPYLCMFLQCLHSLGSLVNGRVCENCWQTALQSCLIIALLMCSRVATLVNITWSSLNVLAIV